MIKNPAFPAYNHCDKSVTRQILNNKKILLVDEGDDDQLQRITVY